MDNQKGFVMLGYDDSVVVPEVGTLVVFSDNPGAPVFRVVNHHRTIAALIGVRDTALPAQPKCGPLALRWVMASAVIEPTVEQLANAGVNTNLPQNHEGAIGIGKGNQRAAPLDLLGAVAGALRRSGNAQKTLEAVKRLIADNGTEEEVGYEKPPK